MPPSSRARRKASDTWWVRSYLVVGCAMLTVIAISLLQGLASFGQDGGGLMDLLWLGGAALAGWWIFLGVRHRWPK